MLGRRIQHPWYTNIRLPQTHQFFLWSKVIKIDPTAILHLCIMDVVCASLVCITVLPLRRFVDVTRGSLFIAFIVRHIYNWNHWTFANCECQKYNTTQKTIALNIDIKNNPKQNKNKLKQQQYQQRNVNDMIMLIL